MKCIKCNQGNMIIKLGKYGLFAACDNFPTCKNTMKLNKFLYEVLKKDGINIYGWNHECWKCHQKTMVYTYFINKQLKPYMDEHIELDSLGLDSLPPVDDYLKMKYSTVASILIIYAIDITFAAVSILYVLGDNQLAIAIYVVLMILLLFIILRTDILFEHKKK